MKYIALMHALENLLKRNIDLVAEETLQNPYFIESINRHKLPVLWCWKKNSGKEIPNSKEWWQINQYYYKASL